MWSYNCLFYVENRQDVFQSIELLSSACQFHACAAALCHTLGENLRSIFRFYSIVWLSSKRNGSTKVCFCHKRYAMQTLNPYRPLCIVFIWKKCLFSAVNHSSKSGSEKQKVSQHWRPTTRYSMSVSQQFVCLDNSELGYKNYMKVKYDNLMLKRLKKDTSLFNFYCIQGLSFMPIDTVQCCVPKILLCKLSIVATRSHMGPCRNNGQFA